MPITERQQQNSSEHRMLEPKHVRHVGQATSMPVCNAEPQKDPETKVPDISKRRDRNKLKRWELAQSP